MPIPESLHEPFDALGLAGIEGRLSLMECFDLKEERPVFVVCAMFREGDGPDANVLMVPVAVMPEFNMIERFQPPMGGEWDSYGDLDTGTPA